MLNTNLETKGLTLKYAFGSTYILAGDILGFEGWGVGAERLTRLDGDDLAYAITGGIRQMRRIRFWVNPVQAFAAEFLKKLAPQTRTDWQVVFPGGQVVAFESSMIDSPIEADGNALIYQILMEPTTAPSVTAGLVALPVNTSLPAITGIARVGQTLTVSNGLWSGSPSAYAYQWRWGDTDTVIAGATASTYIPVSGDIGHPLECVVTAVNAGGSADAISAATAVVAAALPGVPVNSAAPVITGTAQVGQTLSVSNGTWSNSPTSFTYQWRYADNNAPIAGATDQTYVPVIGDVGHPLACLVTATNAGGSAAVLAASTGVVIAAAPSAPVNSVAPAITGTAQVGQTLTCSNGTWSNSPTGYTRQWRWADTDTPISGATAATYVLQASDAGHSIACSVTASGAGGAGSPASSEATAAVLPLAPENTVVPVITGTTQVGQMLTVSNGTWANSPTSYSRQWRWADTNAPISGATGATYVLQAGDAGHTIACAVTASNAGGAGSPASSVATAAVLPLAPINTVPPAVSGLAEVGGTLTATNGTWSYSPTSYTYQWRWADTDAAISGATTSTYIPVTGDIGHPLLCSVTAINAGGAVTEDSIETDVVEAAPTSSFGIAAERCELPNAMVSRTANYTCRRSFFAHPDGEITNLRISYIQAYLNLTGDVVNFAGVGSALQIKAFLEYPSGTFTPILFAGSANVSITDGTLATSDVVAVTIPAAAQYWVRTVLRVGGNFAAFQLPALASVINNGDSASNTDLGNSGMPVETAWSYGLAPFLITGDIGVGHAKSAVIIGDSIAYGEGDVTSSGARGTSGYVARGLAGKMPYVRISKVSAKAAEYAGFSNVGWTAAMALINAAGPTHLISEVGFNDLRLTTSTAALAGYLTTVYSKFTTVTKVYQATITPRSNSTDGWATTANQTPYSTNDMSNKVTSMNAMIRSIGVPGQGYALEAADIAMTARDSNIWKAPPASTLDGAHPTSAMAISLASCVSSGVT